jgi:hypothetical protein
MTNNSKNSSSRNEGKNSNNYKSVGTQTLLPIEDPAEFNDFSQRVLQAIKPTDFIEELWASDFIKLSWQLNRLERLKTEYLQSSAHIGLEKVIEHHVDSLQRRNFVGLWVRKDPEAMSIVNDLLAESGLTDDAITAHTYIQKIEEFERIEKLIKSMAARRNRLLHEIELRRELFARRMQETTDAVSARVISPPSEKLSEAAE